MNRKEEDARATRTEDMETLEPELREVLGNFKASVDAWSEAMMSLPREVKAPARRNWALITQWALGCAVFIGSISGGIYENHRQVAAAKAEEARIAAQQREQAAQKAREEEELMAKVDSDISRQVPSALEPLAALMSEDESTGN